MAQPQYIILATKDNLTYPKGSRIVYTGPRNGVAKGWKVIGGPYYPQYSNELLYS